jgi:hypothetical protein
MKNYRDVTYIMLSTRRLKLSIWWLSLQPPAHAASSFAALSTLKMEAIRSRQFTQDLYGATSQKTTSFRVTAEKTSNFVFWRYLSRILFYQMFLQASHCLPVSTRMETPNRKELFTHTVRYHPAICFEEYFQIGGT